MVTKKERKMVKTKIFFWLFFPNEMNLLFFRMNQTEQSLNL